MVVMSGTKLEGEEGMKNACVTYNALSYFLIYLTNFLPYIIKVIPSRKMIWVDIVSRMGQEAYKILVTQPKGKRPRERTRRGWEDNIKTCLKETGC